MCSIGCNAAMPGPKVREVRVKVSHIDLQGVTLACDVDIENPYMVALATPEFRYGLDIAETPFLSSETETEINIPALGVGTIELPLNIKYFNVYDAHDGLIDAKQIAYRIHGTVLLDVMGQEVRLPVSYDDTFPILKLPQFGEPQVDIPEASLSSARAEISVNVSNPNVFPLGLRDLVFAVSLGEVEMGQVRVTGAEELAPGGNGTLILTGEISGARALAGLVGGQKPGKPAIHYAGSISTPFGDVNIRR